MTKLERKALLGDQAAQKECTEKGIVLSCPFCGSKWTQVRYMGWESYAQAFKSGYRAECADCHAITEAYRTEKEALAHWNTRQSPPIGRCGECKHFKNYECTNDDVSTDHEGGASYSLNFYDDDYCSYFEPRCEE